LIILTGKTDQFQRNSYGHKMDYQEANEPELCHFHQRANMAVYIWDSFWKSPQWLALSNVHLLHKNIKFVFTLVRLYRC